MLAASASGQFTVLFILSIFQSPLSFVVERHAIFDTAVSADRRFLPANMAQHLIKAHARPFTILALIFIRYAVYNT